MEQAFILLIFAAIGLMKWLASNKADKFKPRDPTTHTTSAYGPVQRREEETEEARMRRFMEAHGVPPDRAPPATRPPPPFVPPVIEPPPVPMRKLAPAPRPVAPIEAVAETVAPDFETVINAPESSYTPPPLLTKSAPAVELAPVAPKADLRGLLRSAGSLRDAVILREVLGPPRSLQSAR